MSIFWIPVTISELAFTLALSGYSRMSSTKTIAASAELGTVDFLCVFGIRNKRKKQLRTGDSILRFLFGFFIATPTVAFPPEEFHSARTTTELPVLLTENDNCQAARMIIRTGAFRGVP
jgi:hypothetical protein